MEIHAENKFSFPAIPVQEHGGFEFCCKTPNSPKSPADHLFFNGKLQPHLFPSQPFNLNHINFSRSTSRTSSNGSMDSLLSSRSNSTGSSSRSRSSCSSARTSISEASGCSTGTDRKITTNQKVKLDSDACRKKSMSRRDSLWDHYQTQKPALTPHFSSSRRWQFITPAPGHNLRCQSSRKMTGRSNAGEGSTTKKENKADTISWFDRRFFKWFVSSCLSCYTTGINSLTDKEYNDLY